MEKRIGLVCRCMEKRIGLVRRGQSTSVVFDGVGSKRFQEEGLSAREDRESNRRLAGLCLFGFDR